MTRGPLGEGAIGRAWAARAMGGLLTVVPLMSGCSRSSTSASVEAKNILLIVLDDVGTDKLRLFDDFEAPPYARTPRMDALAENGIRFNDFHASTVCSVSRALIQTGRYPLRTGMGANTELWELPDSEVLISEVLKDGLPPDRAYSCGAFGKWHMGRHNPGHAVNNGYDRFYGTLGNTTDHFVWSKIEHEKGFLPAEPVPQSEWSPSVTRADALRWIAAQDRPFFAYVAFNPPHLDFQVPPKALLSAETQAELASFEEAKKAVGPAQQQLFYRAMLEAVDTEIGNLIDGIDPLERENTVIIVVSDNGAPAAVIQPPHDPSHGKPSVYQLATRVPMIVSGALVPDAPPGGYECNAVVEAVDLFSTLAEIAGADVDQAFLRSGFSPPYPVVDGVSFLPLIRDPSRPGTKPWVFSQYFSPTGPYFTTQCLDIHLRALTDGEYRYIRWVNKNGVRPCFPPTYVHEFYHVAVDDGETDNLLAGALSPAEQAILDDMSRELDLLSEL